MCFVRIKARLKNDTLMLYHRDLNKLIVHHFLRYPHVLIFSPPSFSFDKKCHPDNPSYLLTSLDGSVSQQQTTDNVTSIDERWLLHFPISNGETLSNRSEVWIFKTIRY